VYVSSLHLAGRNLNRAPEEFGKGRRIRDIATTCRAVVAYRVISYLE
jgi:hypothetical protein